MNQLSMPETIRGEWIWSGSPQGGIDDFVLLRRTFELAAPGLDNFLWITACDNYELFINERLVGFGPRANHGSACYVDKHDIGRYLQSGINVIAAIVYSAGCADPGENCRTPGLWCQLEIDGETVVASDREWRLKFGSALSLPRPRATRTQLLNEICDARQMPLNWVSPMFRGLDNSWHAPDRVRELPEFKDCLEIYPLDPPAITGLLDFTPEEIGRYDNLPAWTQVCFGSRHRNHRAVCAAATFLYSETGGELPVRLFSDDPYRFFCNKAQLASGLSNAGEETLQLTLNRGWNRLLLVQEPGMNSMGFVILFPTKKKNEIRIYQDTLEDAPACWLVAGPLKLPLADATASLKFERLAISTYEPGANEPADIANILKMAQFHPLASATLPVMLPTGGYFSAKLDVLRYGFPMVELEASEGDIVDITLGYAPGENRLPSRGRHVRATHTLICREGLNFFTFFDPREGLNLMVTVRKAKTKVRLLGCSFEELVREARNETRFECSDAELNRLWEVGVHTLRRSSAFIRQAEPHAEYDTYLLDCYIDAVNMVVTFGDSAYAAARLRQFILAQFENGDMPVLTFADRHKSQIHQLFFAPIWAFYNYRTSGDLRELKETLPALELLWEFFQSLLDEKTGLIGDIDHRFQLQSRLSSGEFSKKSIPTYANALYCRFLLSMADIFRIVDDAGSAQRVGRQANEIAEKLRALNYNPAKHLFALKSEKGKPLDEAGTVYDLFSNFSTLLGGVMDVDDFETFFTTFFNIEPPFDKSEEARNPYFHFLFLETMFALEQGEWATEYFRGYWQKRISDNSSSWRAWSGVDGEPAPVRFRDGNAVSPNVFLLREFAGVRCADAGHASIYFNPALGQLDWADLTLPTASGKIRVRWEKREAGALYVLIEANYPIKVLPELTQEQLEKTTFELSESIVLLKKPENQ